MSMMKPLEPSGHEEAPSDSSGSGLLSELRGSGEFNPALGEATPSAPRRRISMQTLVIVLTIAASGGALLMMRQQGKAAGLKLQPVKLDLDVDKLPPPRPDQKRILDDLARGTLASAAAEKLEKNPFKLENMPTTDFRAMTATATIDHEAERVRNVLSTIEINAIMQGRVPVARVNGKLVKVGDYIEDLLQVTEIHERSVDFFAGGKTYTVAMGERGVRSAAPFSNPPPPRPGTPPRR